MPSCRKVFDNLELEKGSNASLLMARYVKNLDDKQNSKLVLFKAMRSAANEAYNLYSFKGFGIPELIKIGKRGDSIILIESKKGRSLYELFLENNRHFSINEICLIGIQCIERLKWIHSKNYLHRNIKPENFLIGIDDPHVIYLQNFYFCQRYRSSQTHQHIKMKYTKEIVGTERYGSINAMIISGLPNLKRTLCPCRIPNRATSESRLHKRKFNQKCGQNKDKSKRKSRLINKLLTFG